MEYLRQLLLSNAHAGSFELTSAEAASFYFDTRPLLLDSHTSRMIAGLFYSRIHSDINVVVSGGLSGSLLIPAILNLSCKPMKGLVVRRGKRLHGLQKSIEGDAIVGNCDAVFVDDLISTGTSFQRVRTELKARRSCRVTQAIFLIDRTIKPIDLGIPTTFFFKANEVGELLEART